MDFLFASRRRLPAIALMVLMLLQCLALAHAPVHETMAPPDSVRQAVEAAVREDALVGATYALVTGETTAVGAAGTRDVRTGAAMRPNDRVQIGSVAKLVLAVGVLHLVTQGRVELDAPIARYLPDLALDNPYESTHPLRVRHLLDHTGGLEDARMWQVFTLQGHPDAPLVSGLLRQGTRLAVRHPPGLRFSYSNSGYLVLGMLIEQVTGARYEAFIDSAIFAPLGMTDSTAHFVTQIGPLADPALAMGHFDPATTSPSIAIPLRPASQVTTTAADMARFARFLMGDGAVRGTVLVDRTLLRAMGTATTTEAAQVGLGAGYGLGLAKRDRHRAIGGCHLGNIGTFRSALCTYPASQQAYFVAFNSDPEGGNFDRVDAILTGALQLPPTVALPNRSPSADIADWDGLYLVRPVRFEQFAYLDEITGVTRLKWNGSRLLLDPLQGKSRVLQPVGETRFRLEDRLDASHILLKTTSGTRVISDGQRTWERVGTGYLVAHWFSTFAGVIGLLYLIFVGTTRTVRAGMSGQWMGQPMTVAVITLWLLVLAPLLYLTQDFRAIGDLTPANAAIATLTTLLPLMLVAAIVWRIRSGLKAVGARWDLVAMTLAAQWLAVLAVWGLVPLMLWR